MMNKCAFAAVAISALAGIALGDGFVRMQDGANNFNGLNSSGGAFRVTVDGSGQGQPGQGYVGVFGGPDASTTTFHTFCVERNETINVGSLSDNYNASNRYYAKISPAGAINGGNGGGNPDPVSEATALLYSSFRTGQAIGSNSIVVNGTSNYNYSSGTYGNHTLQAAGLVSALQFAIWYLENEWAAWQSGAWIPATAASFSGQNIASGSINNAYKDVAANFANWAHANAQTGNFYNVAVLQLWGYNGPTGGSSSTKRANYNNPTNYGSNAQDQLTMLAVPLPSTAGLAAMGLLGLGARTRRRSF
jgi:hypothetical protein